MTTLKTLLLQQFIIFKRLIECVVPYTITHNLSNLSQNSHVKKNCFLGGKKMNFKLGFDTEKICIKYSF